MLDRELLAKGGINSFGLSTKVGDSAILSLSIVFFHAHPFSSSFIQQWHRIFSAFGIAHTVHGGKKQHKDVKLYEIKANKNETMQVAELARRKKRREK